MKKRYFAGIVMLILILSVILYSPNCKKQAIEKQTSSSTDLHGIIKTDINAECYKGLPLEEAFNIESLLKNYDSAIRRQAKVLFKNDGIQFTESNYKKFLGSLRFEKAPTVSYYCNHWGTQPCPCGGKYEVDVNHQFWNGK